MWNMPAASNTNPAAQAAPTIAKNAPIRIQKTSDSTMPTMASTNTQRMPSGHELGLVLLELLPAHVGEQAAAEHERDRPEGGEQRADDEDRRRVDQPPAIQPHEDEHDPAEHGEEGRDGVAEDHQREQRGRQRPVSARLEAPCQHAEEQQRQREADREAVLPRQGRRDVAAVDRPRAVEQERQRGHREQGRARERQAEQSAHHVGAQRHAHDPEHRDELHRDAVGQHDVQQHDQQRRGQHVELVGGEAGVPVGRPAGEPPVRQQVVAEVGGAPHVGAHVAARRGGPREQQVRVELREHEGRARQHDERPDPALGGCPQRRAEPACARRPRGSEASSGGVGSGAGARTSVAMAIRRDPPTSGAGRGRHCTRRATTVTMLKATWTAMDGPSRS